MFDLDSFVEQTVEGELDTYIEACPEGTFTAYFDTPSELKAWFRSGEKDGRTWVIFQPTFVIDDPEVQKLLDREKVTVRHKGVFLDLDDAGNLDMGPQKNVGLGKLRAAAGKNTSGMFAYSDFFGAGPVKVSVKQRSNDDDPKQKYADVVNVTSV